MLSIRMKRLGRKGHPTYRVVVQDSQQSPSSGKFVAQLGSYDPHTKQSTLVKEKTEFYLKNGARPSDKVISLFKAEKITLPKWVEKPTKKKRSIRNPDKLRKNKPKDAEADNKPEETASEQDNKQEETESSEDQKTQAAAKKEEESKTDENTSTEDKS